MPRVPAALLVALLFLPARAWAEDEELMPPPPPPTAPDSIIPMAPPPTAPEALEQPPQMPDRLPPTGSLAPEDIPNPPILDVPTTEADSGSPVPEEIPAPKPTEKAQTQPGPKALPLPEPPKPADQEELPEPPPPTEPDTLAEDLKDNDKAAEELKKLAEEDTRPDIQSEVQAELGESKTAEPAPIAATQASRFHHLPPYQRAKPAWGMQFSYSPGALGNGDIADASEGAKANGALVQINLQPTFLQNFGILGFGPTLALYPIASSYNVTDNAAALWSVGGEIRYQARFFNEQIVVPIIGYGFERVAYRLKNLGPPGATFDANSSVIMSGPFFGAWFLLNIIEPNQAAMSYIENGLIRSYLTAEVRSFTGSDDNVDLTGNSYFFGFRIEF